MRTNWTWGTWIGPPDHLLRPSIFWKISLTGFRVGVWFERSSTMLTWYLGLYLWPFSLEFHWPFRTSWEFPRLSRWWKACTSFCPNCEDYVETAAAARGETYTVKGRRVTVPVTSNRCVVCDETIRTDAEDQAVLDAIHVAAEEALDAE